MADVSKITTHSGHSEVVCEGLSGMHQSLENYPDALKKKKKKKKAQTKQQNSNSQKNQHLKTLGTLKHPDWLFYLAEFTGCCSISV